MMDWTEYFMSIARQAAAKSKCMSRNFGAVIVKNRCVVSMGYNGPARGTSHCDIRKYGLPEGIAGDKRSECPRRLANLPSGQGLEYCTAGHAERNAIAQAAMNGISTLGAELYTWSPLPCKECAIMIINSGIKKVYYLSGDDYDNVARKLFIEAGVDLESYDYSGD